MTKERLVYLQNNYPLADSGEFTFDIGTDDIITRLDVELKATNGATNNQANTIANVLTSIELMSGSEPFISLAGNEAMGMCAYRTGRWPMARISETPGAVQFIRVPIDFGRWYCDEQLSLDLSKFKHVQMRVKWDLAAVTAVGATGFVTATTRLTVIAHVLEGAQNPMGYLSLKRHALFTTVASGIEPIILPVDKPIRAIGIRSFEAGTGLLSGLSNIRLSANEDRERPIDLLVADFLDSLAVQYGAFTYKHVFHLTNADVGYTLLKYREIAQLSTEVIDTIALYVTTGIGEGAIVKFTASTGAALATDGIIDTIVHGYLPFSMAYLAFGSYDDPNQWFNAPNYKSLRLDLTQDNAGAACSVVLEQLNSY